MKEPNGAQVLIAEAVLLALTAESYLIETSDII